MAAMATVPPRGAGAGTVSSTLGHGVVLFALLSILFLAPDGVGAVTAEEAETQYDALGAETQKDVQDTFEDLQAQIDECEEKVSELKTEANQEQVGMASTLLGSMVAGLGLFYLGHHPDRNVQGYFWAVLSCALFTFVSVSFFNGIDYFLADLLGKAQCMLMVVEYSLVLMLFLTLLAFLTRASGSGSVLCSRSTGFDRALDVTCGANVLSYMLAAAACRATQSLRSLELFPGVFSIVVPVTMTALLVIVLMPVLRRCRRSCMRSNNGDGEPAASDEPLAFAEVEAAGTILSFLFMVAVPAPHHSQGLTYVLSLLGVGVTLIVCATLMEMLDQRLDKNREQTREVLGVTSGVAWTVSALALIWSAQSQFTRLPIAARVFEEPDELGGHMVLALVAGFFAAVAVFILDFVADASCIGLRTEAFISKLIRGPGIVVGTSWEACCREAFGVISGETFAPRAVRLLMTCAFALMALPALRVHILPRLLNGRRHGHEPDTAAAAAGPCAEEE